jgi:hypothetical protein
MSEKLYVKAEVKIWLNYGMKWYNKLKLNDKYYSLLKPEDHPKVYFTQRVVLYNI